MKRTCAGVIAGALLAFSSLASGFDALSWTAPNGCPDRSVVLAEVQRLLANSSVSAPDRMSFTGNVVGSAGRYVLQLADAEGSQRTLEATHCDDLGAAAAVAIALAIDPQIELPESRESNDEQAAPVTPATETPKPIQAGGANPPPPQQPKPLPPPAHSVPPVQPVPVRAAYDARPALPAPAEEKADLGFGGYLDAMLDGGTLGTTSYGVAGGVAALSGTRWRAQLGAVGFPAQDTPVEPSGAYGSLALYAGRFTACHGLFSEAGRFALCPGVEVGAVSARGHGVDQPESHLKTWAAGDLNAMLFGELDDQVYVRLSGGLVVPFTRYEFTIDGQRLHRAPRLAGRLGVGFEFRGL